MIDAIILSKDRPAQLELCLSSIEKNSLDLFTNGLCVFYHASNHSMMNGYMRVQELHPNVEFVAEFEYQNNIKDILDVHSKYSTFFTDDDIFYRELSKAEETQLLEIFDFLNGELACFSLRLGLNTYIQDPYNNAQTIPPTSGFIGSDDLILWEWRTALPYMNFGYPLSVDGHVFLTDTFRDIFNKFKFNNPNQQESAMQGYNDNLPRLMGAFKQSCVVNTPLNRVQETCLNRSGETHGQDVTAMNNKFLAGYKLDLSSMDFSNVIGCHQELDIKWVTM